MIAAGIVVGLVLLALTALPSKAGRLAAYLYDRIKPPP